MEVTYALSRMLKQRAKAFLEKYTPQVRTLVEAFTVCQHDTLAKMSDAVASVADVGPSDVVGMKKECLWFIEANTEDLVEMLKGHSNTKAAKTLETVAAVGATASSSA